jgi:hypothetical protein
LRWRRAFDNFQRSAEVQRMLDNAQMFYDAKRDASLARASRSATEAAAARAGGADGGGFDDDGAGGAGGDDDDAALEHALRVFMARLQEQRLVGALAPDVAALHDHVRLTIDESARQRLPRVDLTMLDVDAVRTAVAAATTHGADGGDVPDVGAATCAGAAEHDTIARLPVLGLSVELVDSAINTLTAPAVPGESNDVRVLRLRAIERPTIGDVSAAFTLNAEQHEAFRLAATPVLSAIRANLQRNLAGVVMRTAPQRVVIAGAGGCGKSRVIDALRHLAEQWHVQHAVIVTAYTGAAAVLLRGRTLHSVLGMNRDSADVGKKRKRASRDGQNVGSVTKRALDTATVLVIDEVSMISIAFLDEIDQRLRTVRAVEESFGGLTVVVAGDLLQLPPVGGRPLWDVTDQAPASVRGRELWRLFVSVVFLRTNMRCDDALYAAMLDRVRYGCWLDEDIAMINTRLLGAGAPPLQLATTDHVATLVHTNASRVEINRNALLSAAAQLPAGDIVCAKGDISATRGGRVPTAAELELLYDIDDSKDSNNLSSTLYLYVGQRVSVTENVATALGAANGSQGNVVGFKFADTDDGAPSTELRDVSISGVTIRVAMCNALPELVFVHLLNNAAGVCALPGLPANVFAFSPCTKSVSVMLNSHKLSFRLTQFPLVPCAAATLHKVQGQSMTRAVVGLWRDRKMVAQNAMTAYVALSRLRTLAGLYITQPLTRDDCDYFVPALDIVNELERLDALQAEHLRTSSAVLAERRALAAARAAAHQVGGKKRSATTANTSAMRKKPSTSTHATTNTTTATTATTATTTTTTTSTTRSRSAMLPHRGDTVLDWVMGDGNCFWRAICRQLHGGGAAASDHAHSAVRAAVVDYALHHNDDEHWQLAECVPGYHFIVQLPDGAPMRTADDVRHAEWLRIIEQLNTDRAWDDPLFDWLVPQLCARALGRSIRVFQEQVSVPHLPVVAELHPVDADARAAHAQQATLEIYRAHDHYWSVRSQ